MVYGASFARNDLLKSSLKFLQLVVELCLSVCLSVWPHCVNGLFTSALQKFVSAVIPTQKYHTDLRQVLNGYGAMFSFQKLDDFNRYLRST